MGSSIFSRNWPQLGAARVEQASFFGFCLFGVVRLARAQGVDYDAEQRKAPTPALYHGGITGVDSTTLQGFSVSFPPSSHFPFLKEKAA
ncbi:hypothetical protein [Vibrio cholerae]|uniref:hypothetical protein n=1 Tax=Vibrio cholerae TaxID=666 RepID=UPI0015E10D1A|nr:hypothetical protein [Vibrio cholerae]